MQASNKTKSCSDAGKVSPASQRWAYAAIPIGIVLTLTVAWPLRNIALVYWVRGSAAYGEGIRVLRGKPTRFSDGQLAPNLPDFVTGMLAFIVAMSAAVAIAWFLSRISERIRSTPSTR